MFSHFRPILNLLAGEATPGTMVAETEACNGRSLLKTEGLGTRPHDEKHELKFCVTSASFQVSFVKLLSFPVLHKLAPSS